MTDSGNKRADRRNLLKTLTVAAGATFAGVAGVPAMLLVAAPGKPGTKGRERWIATMKLDALVEGVAKRVLLVADTRDAFVSERDKVLGSAWLVRKGDTVVAYSTVCPHLGCSIDVRPVGGFTCPCHDSNFSVEGRCEGGPSPRDMDKFATRIENGVVHLDFRKYRQGTKSQEELA